MCNVSWNLELKQIKQKIYTFICMCVPGCVYVYWVYAGAFLSPEVGARSPGLELPF